MACEKDYNRAEKGFASGAAAVVEFVVEPKTAVGIQA
jgi:hypothetical protein